MRDGLSWQAQNSDLIRLNRNKIRAKFHLWVHKQWKNNARPSVSSVKTTMFDITVMSHERHGISNHWQLHCLLNNLFRGKSQENIKFLCYWPLERGIHWWPVDSPHKGPVTWKMFHEITSSDIVSPKFLLWSVLLLKKKKWPWHQNSR